MAYDMVSPGPSVRRRSRTSKGKRRKFTQPVDIREGMANAIVLVREVWKCYLILYIIDSFYGH